MPRSVLTPLSPRILVLKLLHTVTFFSGLAIHRQFKTDKFVPGFGPLALALVAPQKVLGSGLDKAIIILSQIFLTIWIFPFRVFIYSFQLKGGKPTPFLIWFFALAYTLINGYVQGRHLAMFAEYDQSWFTDPRFVGGVLLFFTGMMLNIQADNILTNLRKPGETGYKIPRGKYSTCCLVKVAHLRGVEHHKAMLCE